MTTQQTIVPTKYNAVTGIVSPGGLSEFQVLENRDWVWVVIRSSVGEPDTNVVRLLSKYAFRESSKRRAADRTGNIFQFYRTVQLDQSDLQALVKSLTDAITPTQPATQPATATQPASESVTIDGVTHEWSDFLSHVAEGAFKIKSLKAILPTLSHRQLVALRVTNDESLESRHLELAVVQRLTELETQPATATQPATQPATGLAEVLDRLSKLEQRLSKLEHDTGVLSILVQGVDGDKAQPGILRTVAATVREVKSLKSSMENVLDVL